MNEALHVALDVTAAGVALVALGLVIFGLLLLGEQAHDRWFYWALRRRNLKREAQDRPEKLVR